MRDPNRIQPILDDLGNVWRAHPDMRLGQLLVNLVAVDSDLYFVEDEALDKTLVDVLHKGWPVVTD